MALLASLCLCCLPENRQKQKLSNDNNTNPSYHAQPYQRPAGVNPFQPLIDENDPFHSSQPLPRYTERPISIQEKTLAFAGRRSIADDPIPRDEKNIDVNSQTQPQPQPRESSTNSSDDHSDASSTFSLPSSFGNTSTATTETPPPAYSAFSSRAPSQRSMSIHGTRMTYDDDTLSTNLPPSITPPPAALNRGRDSHLTSRRASITYRPSLEPRRRTPSLPPTYSRP